MMSGVQSTVRWFNDSISASIIECWRSVVYISDTIYIRHWRMFVVDKYNLATKTYCPKHQILCSNPSKTPFWFTFAEPKEGSVRSVEPMSILCGDLCPRLFFSWRGYPKKASSRRYPMQLLTIGNLDRIFHLFSIEYISVPAAYAWWRPVLSFLL